MLELPGSPDGSSIPNNLRSAKSFADLRTLTPSPSPSSSSYHLNAANGIGALPTSTLPGGASTARFGDYGGYSQQTAGSTPNLTPNTPGQSTTSDASLLTGAIGSLNIGSFEPAVSQPQMRSTPGAIGSQRPGAGGRSATSQNTTAERQPRGADWDNPTGGFSARGRANGHMQRGSGEPFRASSPLNVECRLTSVLRFVRHCAASWRELGQLEVPLRGSCLEGSVARRQIAYLGSPRGMLMSTAFGARDFGITASPGS
jgi:hypothetical protein